MLNLKLLELDLVVLRLRKRSRLGPLLYFLLWCEGFQWHLVKVILFRLKQFFELPKRNLPRAIQVHSSNYGFHHVRNFYSLFFLIVEPHANQKPFHIVLIYPLQIAVIDGPKRIPYREVMSLNKCLLYRMHLRMQLHFSEYQSTKESF